MKEKSGVSALQSRPAAVKQSCLLLIHHCRLPFLIFILIGLLALQPVTSQVKTYIVNSTGDQHDLDYRSDIDATNSSTTPCDVGGGNCTLRAAIEHSRTDGVPVLIKFNIPLPLFVLTARIQVVNENYPAILDGVIIDGTTQPGYDTDTKHPLIELDGRHAFRSNGSPVDGLLLTGGNNVIKGLHIHSFSGRRIKISPTGGSLMKNVIMHNIIGSDPAGILDLGNGQGGILIDGTFEADSNRIIENIITGNKGPGVQLNENTFLFQSSARSNHISKNSIFNNDGLGIQFSFDFSTGVTPNHDHTMMAAQGPNLFTNYPELTDARISNNKTHIEGRLLKSLPNLPFTIEFFASDSCHLLGNGEGQTYLGSTNVQTDANGQVQFVVDLDKLAPSGSVITATSTDIIKNTSEFSRCLALAASPVSNADLRLEKMADKASVRVGENVTFTVLVTNNGPDAATGIVVKDLLPVELLFVHAIPSSGTYDPASGMWAAGSLNNAGTAKLTLIAQAIQTGNITNSASIISSDQTDPNNTNNQGSAPVTILPAVQVMADLGVSKTADPLSVIPGENVTYTIGLANNGPDAATGVKVMDLLPAGLSLVQAIPSVGTYDASTGVWTVGTLNNASLAKLTLIATATQPGVISNTASINASDQPDPNAANNQVSVKVSVVQQVLEADLVLAKGVDKNTTPVGTNVTFTITILNAGPAAATGIVVSDIAPAGLKFIQANASAGSFNIATGTWTVGTMASGTKAELSIVANTSQVGSIINKAAILASNVADPNTNNNQSSVSVNVQQGVDVQALFQDLTNKINGLIKSGKLSQLHGRLLILVVQQANELYNRGDNNNAVVALRIFKLLVSALVQHGQLSRANGQMLNDAAQAIIDAIQAGAVKLSGITANDKSLPQYLENAGAEDRSQQLTLKNYPNPFRVATDISFNLPKTTFVQLRIFDASGRMVGQLLNQVVPRGVHSVSWRLNNLPAGVYTVQLKAGDLIKTHRMVYVR